MQAGWHEVEIRLLARNGIHTKSFKGSIYVPHTTQFVFVSDIDDTIQISHSTHWGKKFAILLTSTPATRKPVHQIGHLFEKFVQSNSSPSAPNPFFYISNSEWNLYDDLTETFGRNGLPEGVFLLNHLKRSFGLLDVGTAPGNTKLRRASRILDTFRHQKFVLIGDDSQKDPAVYASLAEKYRGRIYAVYLRQVGRSTLTKTTTCLDRINRSGTFTCISSTTDQALQHARNIGLL